MKKIIIIGSRTRDDDKTYHLILNELRKHYEDGDIIVSGGCKQGGDRFAKLIAQRMGLIDRGEYIEHLPENPPKGSPRWMWARAMYARNEIVAAEADENTIVIASGNLEKTGGTEHTLGCIRKLNKVKERNIRMV